ncbi:FAD-dependent oxidoreductase [Spirillospora sp. NPDC048911]|uniref:FAD-dependent oxidoreductase n=1 Tax=Spirillospora sp. NPDC048911 TaxID=3364527 RepID=UPI003713A030
MTKVLVVGAGVIGLSCAVRLAEAGHDVQVVARDLPTETTSSVAAALWYPYLAFPQERVTAWSAASYKEFADLAEIPETGIRVRRGSELLKDPQPDPWWSSAVPSFERLPAPPPPYADGWSFESPVIDMAVYLPWLHARLESLGATVTRHDLPALPDAPLIVNCSGLGARDLAADHSLTPVRGQVVVLEQFGLNEWWIDDNDPERLSYVVPRTHDIVVGGTAQHGDWNRDPDAGTAQTILARAERMVPALAGARVLRHKVGLRPARPTVRLDVERLGDRRIVHCYGHGGAGVTLSWGCATEVTNLITTTT